MTIHSPIKPLLAPQSQEPTLREVRIKDGAGRIITEFEGSPSAWLRQFACNPKRITQIRTRS